MTGPSILIIEDDVMQARLLETLISRRMKESCLIAGSGNEALDLLGHGAGAEIRAVVMDMMMPGLSGLETLPLIQRRFPDLPVVFLTASAELDLAVQALRAGAFDFLTKPYDAERVVMTLRNALKLGGLSRTVQRLKWAPGSDLSFSDLIGAAQGLAPVIALGDKIAKSNVPVLILGETGVGKEAFARALHGESFRAGRPFVPVNCGAIPENLVESLLFGHEKGAFTGASEKTAGKFREAEGGTIFLDEVGELPPAVQVKLLRVLQQQEVEPVGAGKPVPVNVRVISATHRDLARDVHEGRFREDLYFRLNVMPVTIPPLRQRVLDIPALARHFVARFAALDGLPEKNLSPEAEAVLMRHLWPGNVRELENAIRRALVLAEGPLLEAADFDFSSAWSKERGEAPAALGRAAAEPFGPPLSRSAERKVSILYPNGLPKPMVVIEREVIETCVAHFGGSVIVAAMALEVAKSTLYRKLREKPDDGIVR